MAHKGETASGGRPWVEQSHASWFTKSFAFEQSRGVGSSKMQAYSRSTLRFTWGIVDTAALPPALAGPVFVTHSRPPMGSGPPPVAEAVDGNGSPASVRGA